MQQDRNQWLMSAESYKQEKLHQRRDDSDEFDLEDMELRDDDNTQQ